MCNVGQGIVGTWFEEHCHIAGQPVEFQTSAEFVELGGDALQCGNVVSVVGCLYDDLFRGDVPLGFYAEKRQDSFAVIVEVKHCGVLV